MSLGIPPELRQAGSYLFARRNSPDKRISSVLDFLTRCRLIVTDARSSSRAVQGRAHGPVFRGNLDLR